MFSDTLNSLKTNTLIITPNRRLASFLTKQIASCLSANEVLAIRICSWQDALVLFRQQHPLSFTQGLLSAWQSRFVWQGILRASQYAMGLINLSDTQQLAASAADLCINWLVDPDDIKDQKDEADIFLDWWKMYSARCKALQCCDETDLASIALTAARRGELREDRMAFYGFDEFTPLQSAFIEALREQGCEVTIESGHTFQAQPVLSEASHAMEEWTAAILHAQSLLAKTPEPALPIGIVIPDIQRHWVELSALLIKLFHPEHHMPGSPPCPIPYNISSGSSLSEQPAIYCALTILDLNGRSQIKAETLSYLLGSPFIQGGIVEQSTRACFDTALRTSLAMEYDCEEVLSRKDIPPVFHACLSSLQRDNAIKHSFSHWADSMLEVLKAWGWPGQRTLDSITYQAVKQFYDLLSELRTLDAVSGPIDYETAVHQLRSQLKHSLFQPQTEDKPIQILGLLEAAGMSFSHLWVCGMDDSIPAVPKPNPLIPIPVQRTLCMPHASYDREWEYSQKMVARLSQSSPDVIFSYASHNAEGYVVQASCFVKALPGIDLYERNHVSLAERILQSALLEDMPPDQGIPWKGERASGGSALLKAQIACPFSAYARFRLRAKAPESASLGLSMLSRGQLLHSIMQALMGSIPNSEYLKALSEKEEDQLITKTIDQAISTYKPTLSEAQAIIEKKRMFAIIKASLQADRERGEFRVKGLEVPIEMNLSGVNLHLRIDRCDETPDGDVLIDYKTGKVDKQSWDPQNVDDPQLPLYALAQPKPPAGIAFSVLRKEEIAYQGEGIINMPGISALTEAEWCDHMESWHQTLAKTAQAYKEGVAEVAPKYGKYTCEYCDLVLCCRLSEMEQPA